MGQFGYVKQRNRADCFRSCYTDVSFVVVAECIQLPLFDNSIRQLRWLRSLPDRPTGLEPIEHRSQPADSMQHPYRHLAEALITDVTSRTKPAVIAERKNPPY